MESNDYVVLVHGLGRSSKSMLKASHTLSEKGYKTVNLNYPSRSDTIENLSEKYLREAIEQTRTDISGKIHFLTHSMGGMMVRYYLSKNIVQNVGRLVMLAPPNKGSKYADRYSKYRLSPFIFGPALRQMTSERNSIPNTLPAPTYETGVIAGFDDGKVTIDQTRLEGMTDFLVVPGTHTFIMNSDQVIEATNNFFKTGTFSGKEK